ncbi:MAG: methylated-DNA--[protein]-cysteine S-methyltransferase [Verrucomicrobiota bacterium JB022]|nr:methylated-DNA--[protein]-cysteine S-methyltransferase [Verrucomicrobiota bacterium JB022]
MPSHYHMMARAIERLAETDAEQLPMETVAAELGLSRAHFQRLFVDYVGLSPHRYRQYLHLEGAKADLRAGGSVLEAALANGFSGPGRLHDTLVQFESMTPGEFKQGGLPLVWGVHESIFGAYLLALSPRGISALFFLENAEAVEAALAALSRQYPEAALRHAPAETAPVAARLFCLAEGGDPAPLRLWVRGTNFQVQVWRALLRIPTGSCVSYRQLAASLGRPSASRAVGQAVGANPISWLIPCHRVLRGTGGLSGYRWGPERKRRLLAWELAQENVAQLKPAGDDEIFAGAKRMLP